MKAMLKLTAVSALFASHFAFAGTYDLGNLGPPGSASITVGSISGSVINDSFTFTINAPANASGSAPDTYFFGFMITDVLTVSLFDASNTQVGSTDTTPNAFSFTNLAAGSYTLKVTSKNTYYLGGYTLSVSTGAAATAVPEPEQYAMMLAGLGLVGFAARRKMA